MVTAASLSPVVVTVGIAVSTWEDTIAHDFFLAVGVVRASIQTGITAHFEASTPLATVVVVAVFVLVQFVHPSSLQ